MFRRRASQPDDDAMLLWDAVGGGQAVPVIGQDAETAALISQFFALDEAPGPDATFLHRLETELMLGGARSGSAGETGSRALLSGPVRWRRSISQPWSATGESLSTFGRWAAAQAAMLVLLVIAIGSFGIVYLVGQSEDTPMIPAIIGDPVNATPQPATPVVETLLTATFDPAAVGAEGQTDWTTASLHGYSIKPGEGFALDEATWGPSLNVFVMLEGELTVQSGSPSLVIRRGSNVPEALNAGARVTMVAGDSWIAGFSTEVSGQNDGTSDAQVLIHANTKDKAAFDPPRAFRGAQPLIVPPFDDDLSIQFDGPVTFDIQRVTLGQGEELDVLISDSETLLLTSSDLYGRSIGIIASGAPSGTSINATALNTWTGDAYTITRDISGTGTLYLARMGSATGEPSTAAALPVVQKAESEELVEFLADPASSQIGKPEEWDEVAFEIGHLEPGGIYDASLHLATCCHPGLAVLHVIDGSMNIKLSGQATVIRAGQDPVTPEIYEPPTEIALEPGDTIWYGIEAVPVATNPGADQLKFLNLSAYFDPGAGKSVGGNSIPGGYTRSSPVYVSNENPMPPGAVSTAIERIELDPGETFTVTASENLRQIALIDQGFIQFHKDTGSNPVPPSLIHSRGGGYGVAFHTYTPGDYIIENTRDDPAVLYVLTMTTVPD